MNRWVRPSRVRAYRETVERLGLVSHGEVGNSWSPENGLAAVRDLPDDSPVTAVVAASDDIAMGVVRGALARGWDVPGHLSVFGWDDRVLGRWATPALSTVRVDREAKGRQAMLWLIAAVRGEPAPEPPDGPLNQMVVRESTGPPRTPHGPDAGGRTAPDTPLVG